MITKGTICSTTKNVLQAGGGRGVNCGHAVEAWVLPHPAWRPVGSQTLRDLRHGKTETHGGKGPEARSKSHQGQDSNCRLQEVCRGQGASTSDLDLTPCSPNSMGCRRRV